MTTTKSEPTEGSPRNSDNLDARYGAIGISAVAAAVRYQGQSTNPSARPAEPADTLSKRKSALAA